MTHSQWLMNDSWQSQQLNWPLPTSSIYPSVLSYEIWIAPSAGLMHSFGAQMSGKGSQSGL